MPNQEPSKGPRKKNRYLPCLLAALLILTLAASLLGRDILLMPRYYALSTTARAVFGSGGEILLIDRGKSAIELLDAGGVLRERLNGGTPDGFYYAEQTVRAEDGTLYVTDRAYLAGEGAAEMVERVVELYNGAARVVWEQTLSDSPSTEQGAAICELQLYDGALWFLRNEEYGLGLYSFRPGGTVELVRRVYCGDAINDASIDLSTGTLAIATRRGYVRVLHEAEQLWITVPSDTERLMPQSISARNGSIWFSDVYANRLCHFSALRPQDGFETAYRSETRLIDVSAGADGTAVLASDGAGFYHYSTGEGGATTTTTYTGEVRFARFPLTLLLRGCLAVAAAIFLWLLWKLLKRAARLFRSESALRVLLVVLASASVSAFVAYSLMTDLFAQEDDTLVENMRLFAETVVQSVGAEDLRELEWETDYGGSAFLRVRRPMDSMLALARTENGSYSYSLYRLDGEGQVRLILNSSDSVMCGQPYDMAGQEYIAESQRTGKSYAFRTRDADGSRIAVLVPVTDAAAAGGGREKTPFAVLEVSVDLSLRTRERINAVWNMVLNTACATAVVVMLILEGIFLLSFLERKRALLREGGPRRDGATDGPSVVPVRSLMFLSYVADSMQDIFIAVLVFRLYTGGLPLPDGVAVALPMSGQLLMMAVFSAFTGRVAERLGTRRVMTGGVLLQLCGFLCCLLTGTYGGIMAGKVLIGAGMGTIYVTCNTVAVSGTSEASIAGAFAGVSAGTLSGITIGAGLSSVFLSIGGWRLVYGVGAALLLCALWLSLSSENVIPGKSDTHTNGVSFPRFFFNRRVLGFFALILVPFMMALSYREYFFPLFAESQGIGENHIGQLFMLCGILTIYVGPRLSGFLIRVLGSRWSIVLASGGMGAALLLFVLRPVVWAVLAGLFLMSLSVSFAYTCQYMYFEELPDSLAYGPGKAMSVYSVFESLGQVLGPIVYGALLSFGWQRGIGVFLGLMAALLSFFILLMPGGRNSDPAKVKHREEPI